MQPQNDSKKKMQLLRTLSVIIGLAALAVGIVALAKQELIIACGMLVVAVWQFINFKQWKKHV